MTNRPAPPPSGAVAASSTHSSTSSPLLNAPPIRMRHPLPAPPLQCPPPPSSSSSHHNNHLHQHHHHHHPSSTSRAKRSIKSNPASSRSPRYTTTTNNNSSNSTNRYPTTSASPSTSPYYSSSHPSPAPSTTSTGSASSAATSLRTPPDLLVNASSVGHTAGKGEGLAVNSWNGLLVKPRQPRYLAKEEIEARKKLLANLPTGFACELPSPPPSPKPSSLQPETEVRVKVHHPHSPQESPSIKRTRSSASTSSFSLSEAAKHPEQSTLSQQPPPPSQSRPLQRARDASFTPTTLTTLATAYRTAARQLKHAADARTSSLSTSRPSYLAARPSEISALEQLDAVLLFAYAFWLDDLASSSSLSSSSSSNGASAAGSNDGGCIAKNWMSLFGLLRYATNAHSDLGNDVLLGICRLLESAVLRKLHAHDTLQLGKLLSNPCSTSISISHIASSIERQAADLERSDRLACQARNLLSVANISSVYPHLLEKALASKMVNTEVAARNVDPSRWPMCSQFAWPLDAISAMPFLVAFGRCAVYEHARVKGVAFDLLCVPTS